MQDNYVKLLRPRARDLGKRDGRDSISAHNLTPNLTPGQESWCRGIDGTAVSREPGHQSPAALTGTVTLGVDELP
jgi:hypothetical protein